MWKIATSFLIKSSSNLQINMRVICPLVYDRQSPFIFDRIFIRLAGNEDSHKIMVRLDFGSDPMIGMRVTCHLVSVRHIIGKMLSG